jgi:hypothetical protein
MVCVGLWSSRARTRRERGESGANSGHACVSASRHVARSSYNRRRVHLLPRRLR